MKKAMKTTLNILKWVLVAVLLSVLFFNVLSMIIRATTGDEMPSVFGVSFAVVRSGSMSGSIEIGDMVIVQRSDDYEVGDVVTFKSGASYTTHRIIGETEDGYITKGDFNNVADGQAVVKSQIKGKVASVLPAFGKITDFIKTPMGLIIMLSAVMLIVFLSKIVEEVKKCAGRRKEDNTVGGQENV